MSHAVALHPWKRDSFLESSNNQLTIDGVNSIQLVEKFGSPLFVYSEKKLRYNASQILTNFREIHESTTVCFASKANANISVLRILKNYGIGVEVNSVGEYFKVKEAGYTPSEIVFNGVAKLHVELETVIRDDIKAINVDSLNELHRILEIAKAINKPASISLRIIPEIKSGATAGWETGTAESKFGMTREEQKEAITLICNSISHVRLKGVHVHIGTQVNDISAFEKEAKFLISYIREINALLPYPFEHINLGGGFPKNYTSSDENWQNAPLHYKANYRTEITFKKLADVLIRPISDEFGSQVEIIVEPGRSLVSDTAILLTKIESSKSRLDRPLFYLDAGYSTLFDVHLGWYFHMINASNADSRDTQLCRIAGPLCDSSDVYYDIEGESHVKNLLEENADLHAHKESLDRILIRQPSLRELPKDTEIGDTIAIFDAGAYSLEMMNDYCGRNQAAAIMISDGEEVNLIRKRSQPEDLLRYDVY